MNPPTEIYLTITVNDLDAIMASMQEQPWKLVNPTIQKLMNQANSGQPALGTPPGHPGVASATTAVDASAGDA